MKSLSNFKMFAASVILIVIINIIGMEAYDKPIIGLLPKETKTRSYVEASYVKFIEAGGGRVVPIPLFQERDYYVKLLGKLNGVLIPGGGDYIGGEGYGEAASKLYEIAQEINLYENPPYSFPVWGTCLGFEAMSTFAADKPPPSYSKKKYPLVQCSAYDYPSPLQFVRDPSQTRMFLGLGENEKQIIQSEDLTANYHKKCVNYSDFDTTGLQKTFRVVTTSNDSDGLTYVSSMEGIRFPFYGVQFHPEKPVFEWEYGPDHYNTPHTLNSIKLSQRLGNFFVSEARKNNHHYTDPDEERRSLIYKWKPAYRAENGSGPPFIEQYYYFPTNRQV